MPMPGQGIDLEEGRGQEVGTATGSLEGRGEQRAESTDFRTIVLDTKRV